MSRKIYTKQFREQAMDLVRVGGRDVMGVARDLGMPHSTLNLWLKKAGWVRGLEPAAAMSDDPVALKVRLAELERQVKRLEMEKEILKKATAYFANQNT
jgi:transposase-like protein